MPTNEWSPGEQCPQCGSRHVREYNIQSSLYDSYDDTLHYEAFEDTIQILAHQCETCGIMLGTNPFDWGRLSP